MGVNDAIADGRWMKFQTVDEPGFIGFQLCRQWSLACRDSI